MIQNKILLNVSNTNTDQPSNNITYAFNRPIILGPNNERYAMAVTSFSCVYDFNNVSSTLGNNQFIYNNGTTNKTIILEDGLYQLAQIQEHIYTYMKDAGDWDVLLNESFIQLKPLFVNGKVQITVSNGYKVYFNTTETAKFGILIGFTANQTLVTDGVYEGNATANITNNINKLYIHTNILAKNTSIKNENNDSDVCFVCPLNTGPMFNIVNYPQNPVYLECNNVISHINFQIKDDLGRLVELKSDVNYEVQFAKIIT